MYARLLAFGLWCWLLLGGPAGAWAQISPGMPGQPPLQSPPLPPDSSARPRPTLPAVVSRPWVLRLQTEAADAPALRRYRPRTVLPDSLSVLREVRNLVLALQNEAYLLASADRLTWEKDTVRVQLYVGAPFQWARLHNGNLGDALLTRAGYRERLFSGRPFLPADWARLQQRVLSEAENQGYPFATVRLDSVVLTDRQVSGRVVLERGPVVYFDSLEIVGATKTRKEFLARYLQILPNQPYSQQRVAAATRLLRQLPYLRVRAEPEVRFAQHKARVYLLLEDRPANQFDAIVGILPNTATNTGQKKVQLTGDVTINLRNIRGGGKQLGLQWRKVDAASQLLDAQYVHPGFFGTPLEVSGSFNLYRQTQLNPFQTLRPRLQVTYPTPRAGRVALFTEWRSSQLLSDSTYKLLSVLPSTIDTRYDSYGLDYTWNALDDLYFPRQGMLAAAQAAVGNKRISKNSELNDTLYQRVALRTTQVTLGLRLERYFRLGRNGVLLARVRGEALLNRRLFLNDLFRLGGLNTLRGFNELNFYANQYAVGTVEFRQFTGQDAYVFVFADQAWLRQDIVAQPYYEDAPTGLGAGLSFRTGAGVFQFVYSLGRAEQQKLALNASKIHFGITNRF
ncbi:BamA/TamA family outer membrane protein [Hymenobacter sp. J193]|uniref:BamA/TamA family outer membrane protein n=1 Tax=Hymenobacter sp. J193 TaxID=2898429 RepID=UPI0021516B51|nr:BamA/TamA family outer membrane protein [Hymenobacter sp. J193]MCR5888169.1 BamA/TamA family outer membrane protein [Hymenobacter sp. J193]